MNAVKSLHENYKHNFNILQGFFKIDHLALATVTQVPIVKKCKFIFFEKFGFEFNDTTYCRTYMWKFGVTVCLAKDFSVKGSSWTWKAYKFSLNSSNEKLQVYNFIELLKVRIKSDFIFHFYWPLYYTCWL